MTTTIDGSNSVTINSGAILGITSGTVVASTSGTSIDFTSIPSWVKRITVMLNGVSTSGTSNLLVQVGAGSVTTTGYLSNSASGATVVTSTAGFICTVSIGTASTVIGHIIITLLNSNNWVSSHVIGANSGNITSSGGGNISLGGTLDRVRITTVGGTDTFDGGSINILYE